MSILRHFLTALNLAFKAKYLWMACGILLVSALAIFLAAYFGGRQSVTVGLDVGFSSMRLLLPLLIVLLVQELLSREFDKRYYLASLTYPKARSSLLLGRFAAVFVLVIVLLLALTLLQVGVVSAIADNYPQATPVALGQSLLIVMGFFALDLLVLTTLAVFLAVVASAPSFVLIGTFGFMLIARSYGAIVELLGSAPELVNHAEDYRSSLGTLSYLLPDLGALDVRMLALYGKPDFLPSDWPWLLMGSLGYAMALLALAIWLLQRKRFV
jgi:Cu-processing system permease protein